MTQQNAPEMELIGAWTLEERVDWLEQQLAFLLQEVLELRDGPAEE